jgi:hypothetical protein
MMGRIMGFGGKLRAQAALLRRDPQAFAVNMMQVTHPGLFRERLVDIMNPVPMHVRVDASLGTAMRLNVLNPALSKEGMTGGPNTILNLAVRVARQGIPVRLITTVNAGGVSADWLRTHLAELVGGEIPEIGVETAALEASPLLVGPDEAFMATHWTTAQQLKPVLPRMRSQQFIYMLQEFEAGFYAWSSNHALALETYGMDFWPVTNENLLAEYFFRTGHGRFADPAFRERSIAFDPAIESRVFHPPARPPQPGPKTLLFYAGLRTTGTCSAWGWRRCAAPQPTRPLPAGGCWPSAAAAGCRTCRSPMATSCARPPGAATSPMPTNCGRPMCCWPRCCHRTPATRRWRWRPAAASR